MFMLNKISESESESGPMAYTKPCATSDTSWKNEISSCSPTINPWSSRFTNSQTPGPLGSNAIYPTSVNIQPTFVT